MRKENQGKTEQLRNQNRILLVGNGINDAQKIEWDRMLLYIQEELLNEGAIESSDVIKNIDSISPTLFLESLNKKVETGKIQDLVKEYVADKSNFVHKLWKIYNVILTTNFDNNLVISNSKILEVNEGSKEKVLLNAKSFLYRRLDFTYNKVLKTLFFVHGYFKNPKSICLSFEQYSNNLKLIENHVIQYYSEKNKSKKRNRKSISWIDYFFMENITIDIMGLSLCDEEIDLWWILNYRKKILSIIKNNKIKYYDLLQHSNGSEEDTPHSSKIKLLKSFDVEVVEIKEVTAYNSDFYSLCIKKIQDDTITQTN